MSRSLFLMLSLVLFLVGAMILLSSVRWGSATANAYLLSQGGGMDSTQFMIILQGDINTFRWLGGILSLISGLGMVKAMELRLRN